MTATQRNTRAKSEAATATGTTGGIANGRVDSQKVNTQPIVVVAKLDMTESVKQTQSKENVDLTKEDATEKLRTWGVKLNPVREIERQIALLLRDNSAEYEVIELVRGLGSMNEALATENEVLKAELDRLPRGGKPRQRCRKKLVGRTPKWQRKWRQRRNGESKRCIRASCRQSSQGSKRGGLDCYVSRGQQYGSAKCCIGPGRPVRSKDGRSFCGTRG